MHYLTLYYTGVDRINHRILVVKHNKACFSLMPSALCLTLYNNFPL